MKRYLLLSGMAALLAMTASAAVPVRISEMLSREPLRLLAPAMTDSVAPDGSKFGAASLFGAHKYVGITGQKGTVAKADTAGTFNFTRPASGQDLIVMQTDLRAARFANAKLEVKGTVPYRVFIDANQRLTQDAAGSSTQTLDLRMEPEKDYLLTVKALVAAEGDTVPCLSLALVPGEKSENISIAASPELKHRFDLDNTQWGDRISRVTLSPDGKYYLVCYTHNYSLDNMSSEVWLCDTKSGRRIAAVDGSAQWLPSGSRLSWTEQGREGYDVIELDANTLKQKKRLTGVPVETFAWSPDESYLLYSDAPEEIKEQGPLRRYLTPDDRIPGNRTRSQIYIYKVADGTVQPVTYGHHSAYATDISPDSKRVLYLTMAETPQQAPFTLWDLMQIDVTTMRVDTLATRQPLLSSAIYSPDGKRAFLLGSARCFDNLGARIGEHPIANDFDTQGFIMDLATRKVEAATADFDPALKEEPVWNAADGKIYFRGIDGFKIGIYCLNPADGRITKLNIASDVAASMSMGRDENSVIAYTGAGFDYCGRAYLLNLRSGKSALIDDPMAPELAGIDFGKTEPYVFTNSKGDKIDGMICYPPEFDSSKQYPLIVYYYGGTTPTQASMTNPYVPQLFASRDYMVYVINPSGTIGYGQEFAARHVNAWGKQTADDIIEGVKSVLDSHKFINPKKVGCLGASYGGFMTQYLQTQTDIFAAAVSHAGISNVTSYWGEGYWGYSYNAVAAADSYPWSDPELYTKQGSLFNADKIHTPLLLLHGTVDTNVPIGESIQLFNALKILGRDVEFISVDGENHFISDYPKRQLWQNTIMAWFAKWLQDDPAWWEDLYPARNL